MNLRVILILAALLLPEALACGQYPGRPFGGSPPAANGQAAPIVPLGKARVQRARREEAVARVGSGARALVETYGEAAVEALFTCSPFVGKRLAEFHDAGELARLPRPADLLKIIGRTGMGDDVAVWVMQPEHAEALRDNAAFDAFLADPLGHSLNLRDLATSAAQVRAHRLSAPPAAPVSSAPPLELLPAEYDWRHVAGAGVLVVAILLLLWRKRQRV